ncbi:MAG: anaerobic ribonucleoside-triphosphate reductase activating protein [Desulfobacteraceae bacterium]|jgi:pyruvate formate lyase activating enzyme
MFFGGLQKNSLIDYPGKLSCVCFLAGCNFDCPYCHNPGLVRGQLSNASGFDEQGFYDFLDRQKGFLDGVVVSGGEPTLERDLAALCEKIKQIGYPVKLDTNGSRPQIIKGLIDQGLVDYIAVDIKTDPVRYPHFTKKDCNPDLILSSIRIVMESNLAYEFRTTCVRPIVDAYVIESIARTIEGAKLYALQAFHDTEVLHPEFLQGSMSAYDQDEMMVLKSIAEPWVKGCVVR